MENQTSKSNRHLLIMVLGCAIPMAAVVAIFVLGIPLSQLTVFALVLLCPLSHLLMMRGGMHQHGGAAQGTTNQAAGTGDAASSPGKQPACH